MTLVVALQCRYGIVVGSDGQATLLASGHQVGQSVKKLYDIDGRIVWGAAGSTSMAQALEHVLGTAHPRPDLGDSRAVRDWVHSLVEAVHGRRAARPSCTRNSAPSVSATRSLSSR